LPPNAGAESGLAEPGAFIPLKSEQAILPSPLPPALVAADFRVSRLLFCLIISAGCLRRSCRFCARGANAALILPLRRPVYSSARRQ